MYENSPTHTNKQAIQAPVQSQATGKTGADPMPSSGPVPHGGGSSANGTPITPASETDMKALLAGTIVRASEAIDRTRFMPSEQIKAISKIKAGYIKSKYGIDIIQ